MLTRERTPFPWLCTAFVAVAVQLGLVGGLVQNADAGPYAPAAGQPGSTAIDKGDVSLQAWATAYEDYVAGAGVTGDWQTPEKALGQAVGDSFDIVSLGRGGSITLTFSPAMIDDGAGPDFAVFENSFSDLFLELGYVEVSNDGINFFRFPNDSLTASPVPGFGVVDPTDIDGYCCKYRQGFGTPFDLADIPQLSRATHVRIVDITGDGNFFDSDLDVIYDPYPTSGSAGVDLDAIGILNVASASTETPTVTATPDDTLTPTATGTPTATPMAAVGCAASPRLDCREAGKGVLVIKDKDPDRGDKLVWRWTKGAATDAEDLGDPLGGSDDYVFCLYDQSGLAMSATAPAGGQCQNAADCWKQLGQASNPTGFRYKDSELTPDGLFKLQVRAGDAGKAKALVKGRGELLALPATDALTADIVAQLVGGTTCFSSTFASNDVRKQDERSFKAIER